MELDDNGVVVQFMAAKYLKFGVICILAQSTFVLADDAEISTADQHPGYPPVAQFFEKSQGASGGGFFEGRNLSNNSLLNQDSGQVPGASPDQYGLEIEDNSVSAEDSYAYQRPIQENTANLAGSAEGSGAEAENTHDNESSEAKESLDRTLEVAAEESSKDDRVQSVINASREIREAIFGKEATRGVGNVSVRRSGPPSGINIKPVESVRF